MIGGFALGTSGISKGSQTNAMNKPYALIAAAVLIIAAYPMLAQHQHGGGPPGSGGPIPAYGGAMNDFQRAIAVQASNEQSAQLRSWTQRTANMNRELKDISERSELRGPEDLSNEIDMFKTALVTDNLDRHAFLASLSGAQHSGLRNAVHGLDKINTAMAKAISAITESSGQTQDTKPLFKGLEKAKKAIEAEQHEQQKFLREMGVTV